MQRFFQSVIGLLSLLLWLTTSSKAIAVDQPNLLIMGNDEAKETIARDSRIFRRVLSTMNNQLHSMGFDVYDETAITLDHYKQGRIRRSPEELLDIARSINKPPIDIVVSFSIIASTIEKNYTNQMVIRIAAEMIQVSSGKFLGNFEVDSPSSWTAPAKCSSECLLEKTGEYAIILANDLSAVLGEKLNYLLANAEGDNSNDKRNYNQEYLLVFDNFTSDQMLNIEEYLVIFSGYETHRPIYSSIRHSELLYTSTINSAKLLRNLNKMLDAINAKAYINFSGNRFVIEQTILQTNKKKREDDQW